MLASIIIHLSNSTRFSKSILFLVEKSFIFPRINLKVYDTYGSSKIAANQAKLAVKEGAKIIIGPLFGDAANEVGLELSNKNINVILENDSNRFIYRVSSISIVEEADFEIYESDGSTLHIVTCYPRLKYDKRMIVNADLVGLDSIFD